jgi:response regulator RpfG family c-di-GMP phosphodiesterase
VQDEHPRNRILVVDDDQRLLDGIMRMHRNRYDLRVACGGKAGLELIQREGPFAVVVSDYMMPGMDGIAFLTKVREIAPDTVRLMLTGNTELQAAIDAVNRGQVFRFLSKPCQDEVFAAGVNLALEQHALLRAERELLEQTLRGCVRVLADVLSLVSPLAFGCAVRVQSYANQLCEALGRARESWQVETAALLSQIGSIATPQELLTAAATGAQLTPEQQAVVARQPDTARKLLSNIPRLESIVEMISMQAANASEARAGKPVSMGARILRVALDFDALVARGTAKAEAVRIMTGRAAAYDPQVLACVSSLRLPGHEAVVRTVEVKHLMPGMVIEDDIVAKNGSMVVAAGHVVTPGMIERLRNFATLGVIGDRVLMRVPMSTSELLASATA